MDDVSVRDKHTMGSANVSRVAHKSNVMQRFGPKLRALRTHHQMTLSELALALGHTAHGYISELELGKKMPSAELVLNVARLFNVPTDELMKDELDLNFETKTEEPA